MDCSLGPILGGTTCAGMGAMVREKIVDDGEMVINTVVSTGEDGVASCSLFTNGVKIGAPFACTAAVPGVEAVDECSEEDIMSSIQEGPNMFLNTMASCGAHLHGGVCPEGTTARRCTAQELETDRYVLHCSFGGALCVDDATMVTENEMDTPASDAAS